MLIAYLRSLAGAQRTPSANRQLGLMLSFMAGAINAGGFLAIGYYTSHMTGIVSAMADHLALSYFPLVLGGVAALICFMLGAASSVVIVNWGRNQGWQCAYALPLILEALLLLLFGLLGAKLASMEWLSVPATVAVLCFLMGLQNAIITKISKAEIRTTHVTGIVTDLGIELGKWMYWHRTHNNVEASTASVQRTGMLAGLLTMFFVGALVGAIGFKRFGYITTVPLAFLLAVFAIVPIIDDVRAAWLVRQHKS